MRKVFPPFLSGAPAVGLLLLRLVMGVALVLHSLPKVGNPTGWMGPGATVPGVLQALATLSEFGGGLALIVGLLTPLASLGILCTMCVAASSHIQRGDPFVGKGGSWELATVYATIALSLLLAGPGMFSLDARLFGRPHRNEPEISAAFE